MPGARIIDVVSFMPERIVSNVAESPDGTGTATSDQLAGHEFFEGIAERRFASPDYTSTELGVNALRKVLERTSTPAADLDMIVYFSQFNDKYLPGIGPDVQHLVGATNATVAQVDTGTTSWLSGIRAAQAYIESGQHRTVAVLSVTNFVSRLPAFQHVHASRVLGDGATATLLTEGEPTVLAAYERSHGEHAGLLEFEPEPVDGEQRSFWQDGSGPIAVKFSKEQLDSLRGIALSLVPNAILASLEKAGLTPDDVSLLLTHQPNRGMIKAWRESCGIEPERCHDTLAKYGNLFHSSLPVTLADALEHGMLSTGDIVALGCFSNAGDMVSAMTMRWNGAT
ncbi:3-oxoacyl-ACP synthase [Amycolatopsis antarctica]|uniref:3-oxoacyl-ACP synthase n=1 Tax=Amycolatopsis antarctica TaxID=1854586 RepID=A0A263D0V8_9PSEU|nr:3-oxoacyl-ACP synthase III family protein [Amycolatopsis antarctica]OZM70995.1 3-oxoacyl-ACP synthase [Amycolatopsis antarctica]